MFLSCKETRRDRIPIPGRGGRGFRAHGGRRSEGDLLVLDDDSARASSQWRWRSLGEERRQMINRCVHHIDVFCVFKQYSRENRRIKQHTYSLTAYRLSFPPYRYRGGRRGGTLEK